MSAVANDSKARCGSLVQPNKECPRKESWKRAGAVFVPGRHSRATTTDLRNSKPSCGEMTDTAKPRSRMQEKSTKFSGSRNATSSSAIRPGPKETGRPAEKNSRARCDRSNVSKAKKTRLEWNRQASRVPAKKTA